MSALLNPVNRPGGGTKWGLATYAATLFSLVTIGVAIDIRTECISYIDDREFPGNDIHPPGPNGYQGATYGDAFNTVQTCIFILGGSLTDGFLASSVSRSLAQVPNVSLARSYIVVTLSML